MGRGGQKPAPPGSPITSRRWSKGEDLRPHTPQEYDDDLNNLWVVHGRRYDLAPFRDVHPGGATALDLCRGSDATRLFEQFHVMNDKHRKALKKFEVHEYKRSESPPGVEDTPPPRDNERSAFHEDLKAMLRRHFPDKFDGHKCTYQHAACLGATFALYGVGWIGWWRGEVLTGVFLLGLCAWLIMANLAHDGSHHAVSRRPWINEISLLTSSPLLYSYGSWYQQHCASHHLETNDPDLDVDVQHHPFARWERSMWKDHNLTGGINLLWHFTAFLVSTANMSLTHPWKFVFVPWVRRHLGLELPPFFGADNVEWAAKQKKANKHAPHELAFFRVSGRMHRTGFFDGWRGLLSVLGFIMSVAFVTVPFFRFDTLGTKLLFALGPYVVTSAFFFTVTQISHVQAECQRPDPTKDFFQHQARTSLDYGCTSEFWRFATGGLNVQSIHHVMPVVNSCHYARLYPEFYALCEKYDCAPATEPHILSAGYRHLKHVYDLGELYRGPDYSD